MERNKLWIIAAALLIGGGAIGWGASRMNHNAAAQDSSLVSVDAREGGNLTPTEPYTGGTPSSGATHRGVSTSPSRSSGLGIASGTPVSVTVHETMSSGTVSEGEAWQGTVADNVYRGDRLVIPAGSTVSGTVVRALSAERGNRAELQLALSSVNVNGHSYRLHGSSEPVVAGSPRVRNVGAVAGGTAAGAILGHAIGKSSKGTLIGGILGGTAAGVAVARSKGYQAVIRSGSRLEFTASS